MYTKSDWVPTTSAATLAPMEWPGGKGAFGAQASNWGGSSIALHMSFDGTTFFLVSGVTTSLSADGAYNFELPNCWVRPVVTGGTGLVGGKAYVREMTRVR